MAAGNIKKAQAHQAKTYNAKHARNDFEVGVKVWKKNPLWNTKQKSLKTGPMWGGPYKVEGKTQAGNYLLKGVKGKGKGKVTDTAIPPNQLKRYIEVKTPQPKVMTNMHLKVMEMMIRDLLLVPTVQFPMMLIPYFMLTEDDKGIPGHSSGVPIPGCTSSGDMTIEIEIRQISGCSDDDGNETIEIQCYPFKWNSKGY